MEKVQLKYENFSFFFRCVVSSKYEYRKVVKIHKRNGYEYIPTIAIRLYEKLSHYHNITFDGNI